MLSCTILIVPVEEVTLQLLIRKLLQAERRQNDAVTLGTAAESGMSHALCNKLTDAKKAV